MKKLTTTIIGLSLLVGSALSAQDNFAVLYPAENDDTPTYLSSTQDDIKGYTSLAKLPTSNNTYSALYPAENDDTPDYLNTNDTSSTVTYAFGESSIGHCALSTFYPEENIDTRVQTSC